MEQLAVTVLGHDRPGIIAEVTAVLAELGLNLEDSTMTLLRGHFAFMLICAGDAGTPSAAAVESALAPITADGTLQVAVRPVRAEPEHAPTGRAFLLSVHGGDRPGIVSAMMREVAAAGGNVTDLSTRLSGQLYVVLAEVELPESSVDSAIAPLTDRLVHVAEGLGVGVSLRPQDPDVL